MFTAKDAMKATEMGKPTFDRWNNAGIATATQPSQGTGHPSKWSGLSIVALALTKKLGACGMDLKKASKISKTLITDIEWLGAFAYAVVAVDLETMEFMRDSEEKNDIEEWRIGRSIVIVMDIINIADDCASNLNMKTEDFLNV